jgi:NAD(P)-dependent dehydrogenase (short-subunit alcohol dehydrogenase family)
VRTHPPEVLVNEPGVPRHPIPERPVALVTGGNRGLGLETCRQLAARGLRVLLGARDEARGRAAADAIPGGSVSAVALDVDDPASIEALRGRVLREHGRLDVLVNNAAVLLHEGGDALEIPPGAYLDSLETNLMGPLRLCQAFVPGMRERGYGRVVNVSSGAGQLRGMGGYAPAYALSKAALNALTRLVAHAGGPAVLVNSADPGWVRTDMGGPGAPRGVERGADTIVWLATLPADGPTGGFFHDRRAVPW